MDPTTPTAPGPLPDPNPATGSGTGSGSGTGGGPDPGVDPGTQPTADRLRGMGTTIFADMSRLAVTHDAVNLGQGFPDRDGPDVIIEAAVTALRSGSHNQYAPGRGIPALRHAIATHQAHWWGMRLDPDTDVLVTTGATEAIAAAMLGLVNPGDEVVALDPYYDSYTATIAMAGGIRVPCTLAPPDFRFDPQRLRDAVTPRTRMIVLNTPHNPTGTVLTHQDLQAVADVAIEHDLIVVTDEVYEHLVFDDGRHIPIATLPGMAQRTLTISSAGKTFAVTGWKIGWAVGPPHLVTAVTMAKQFLTYTSGAPLQPAIAVALGLPDEYFTGLRDELQARRDQLVHGLADIGLVPNSPAGGYFVTTDIRPLGFDDGLEFCRMLPRQVGVAAIPHQVFWDDPAMGRHLVRWAFCKQSDVIAHGLDRLSSLTS